jgi:RHS repeat-associated protein
MPEQQVTTIQRDPVTNLVQSITDQLNRVTSYGYDALGNTTRITRLSGTANAVTTYTYEPTYNQVASISDPLSHTTSLTYDSLGNLTTVTDPLSHATTMTYTAAGQVATVSDALAHTTTFIYDGGDLTTIVDPLNRPVTRFIDAIGRLGSVTDPLGNRTIFSYDALKRLTLAIDALGNATGSTYDADGNRLSFTDPRGGVTRWSYDALSRVLTRTDALNQTDSYAYDLAGNVVRFTDRKGQVTGYQYDFLNRRTFAGFGATVAAPTTYTSTIAYAWDGGNRITQIVDSMAGAITRSYDGLNRLTSETTPQGTVGYTYDAAGRRTKLITAGQPDTLYGYDNANRLTGITQGSQTVGFSYDNANRRSSLTLPNGINVAYGYDNANQLLSLVYSQGGTTLGDLSYNYDAAGRKTRQGGSFARVNLPATVSGAIAYDAANRLTTWDGNSLAYDANGNLQGLAGDTYGWDARNRLTGITGSKTASFSYDPAGRRASKTIAGVTTNFLYDGSQAIQELAGTNTLAASLLTGGIDEVFSRTAGGATQSYLTDALNSTLRLTDSAGTKVVDYTYEAYGKATNDNAASGNAFQYTGRENEGTGLQYNRARYYHPTLGRFISEDPIGLAGGYNPYAYVNGNPIRFSDPLGLVKWSGTVSSFGLGPYGEDRYSLESECVDGWKSNVDVEAPSYSFGGGAGSTGSSVNFEDAFNYPNPYVFDGPYFKVSAGVAAGYGTGFNFVIMGGAASPGGWSASEGYDLSAGVSLGQALVSSTRSSRCSCSK